MKKSFKILISAFLISFFLACAPEKPYEQLHFFQDATWHRFDLLSFDLPIKKADEEYTIQAVIRHSEHFEHDRIPLHLIMTFPSGEERIWEQTIVVRNREGNLQGVRIDGIYEIVVPVRTRMRFRETGNCNISVEQIIPKYNSSGIISFGLRLIRT